MFPEEFLKSDKKLITYPNEILTTKAKIIEDFTLWDKVCESMLTIMYDNNGIGLAAPQIGLSYRMFVTGQTKEQFYFNPEILSFSEESEFLSEGCLSLPNILVKVKRSKKIKMKWQNLKGKICTQTYEGLMARIAQHEIDHTLGVLIINRKEQ